MNVPEISLRELREGAETATDLPHARRIDRDTMRSIARAALKGAA